MKNLLLILLFGHISVFCFSQTEEQGFTVSYSEKYYIVRDSSNNLLSDLKRMDFVNFTDWIFLDTLRYTLKEFYDRNLGYDTINKKIGGMKLLVDTSGTISYFSLIIPPNSGDLYSLADVKKLTDLLRDFRFNLPDYDRPVIRRYQGSNRETKIDTFEYFTIFFSTNSRGGVFTSWDGLYERQLTKMVLGTWCDDQGEVFVFKKPSSQLYVKLLNPLTGSLGDFRCDFRDGKLYIYFDQEIPSMISYKFTDDRLTLSGVVGDRKVFWKLKRTQPAP